MNRRVGGRDFGPNAIIDLQREYLRWFDHWLKGVDNGIETEPLVRIFVMGSNQWLTGDMYPLPETRFEKWYLHSERAPSPQARRVLGLAVERLYDRGLPTRLSLHASSRTRAG